jgi:hypothetical protein
MSVMACVQGMTGIVVCTYVMQCDGIFIGSLDFAHLPRTNLVACAVCSAMLYYGQQHAYGLNWVRALSFMQVFLVSSQVLMPLFHLQFTGKCV